MPIDLLSPARFAAGALLTEVPTRMTDFELAAPPAWRTSRFISGPRSTPPGLRPC